MRASPAGKEKAGKEKAEAFNRKLKFQGGLRQQMVTKTVEERESLVEELVRERKEKEEMARMRVETVEQLKISLNAQIDAVLGNLKVEMGDAEQAATPKEAVEITKIALENKRASAAVAPPKKSGSILGAIGGLFGMTSATEEGTEEATAPEPAATASDDEAVSEAAIKAAVCALAAASPPPLAWPRTRRRGRRRRRGHRHPVGRRWCRSAPPGWAPS